MFCGFLVLIIAAALHLFFSDILKTLLIPNVPMITINPGCWRNILSCPVRLSWYALWGDYDILESTFQLGAEEFTVIGVVKYDQQSEQTDRCEVYIPLQSALDIGLVLTSKSFPAQMSSSTGLKLS